MLKHIYSGARDTAAVAILLALLALYGTAAAAASTDGDRVVALQFDRSASALLKATPHALYSSRDAGRTWKALPLPWFKTGMHIGAIAVSAPGDGTSAIYVAGPGIGVLRTEDAGRSWSVRGNGLPDGGVVAVAAHADQPRTVYAVVEGKGVFRSEDAGLHWKLMDGGPRGGIVRLVHSNMPGSMQTGWFFAATAKGVRRSMDCFCGWRDAGGLDRAVHSVAYDPREPQRVYAAADDGLYLSVDGGEEWQRLKAPGPGTAALAATPSAVLYAMSRDGVLFRSADRGATWTRVDA